MGILKVVSFIKNNGNSNRIVEGILKKTDHKNLLKQIFKWTASFSPV